MSTKESQELRHAVGSLIVVGVSAHDLTPLERAWLKLVRPGGIILFKRNITDTAQTRQLINQATELCAEHALRCVDLEGGSVDRLRDALAPMPSAADVYKASIAANNEALMQQQGSLIAESVRAFGFNTTLAPVIDLALPVSASVMGSRVVSADPSEVTRYAHLFLKGLAEFGVVGCAKHFPGLGAGTLDSHIATPSIERSMKDLRRNDLAPYIALRDELPMVMVNHASYPQTKGGATPASISPYWITKTLRKEIGYDGLIFSDDMEMGGILNYMSIEEASLAAFEAGMDTIEICHSAELILRAYEAVLHKAEQSNAFRNLILKRAKRVKNLRRRQQSGFNPTSSSDIDLDDLRTRLRNYSAEIQLILTSTTSASEAK